MKNINYITQSSRCFLDFCSHKDASCCHILKELPTNIIQVYTLKTHSIIPERKKPCHFKIITTIWTCKCYVQNAPLLPYINLNTCHIFVPIFGITSHVMKAKQHVTYITLYTKATDLYHKSHCLAHMMNCCLIEYITP